MAFANTDEHIIQEGLWLIKNHRCGFDTAKGKLEYFPMSDELGFIAIGVLVFIYKFKDLDIKEFRKELREAIIPKWADPIC